MCIHVSRFTRWEHFLRCQEARCFALGLGLHAASRTQGLTFTLTCLALPPRPEGSVDARARPPRSSTSAEPAFDAWPAVCVGPCGRVLLTSTYVSDLRSAVESETRGRVAHQSVSSCGAPPNSRIAQPRLPSSKANRSRRDLASIPPQSHVTITPRSRGPRSRSPRAPPLRQPRRSVHTRRSGSRELRTRRRQARGPGPRGPEMSAELSAPPPPLPRLPPPRPQLPRLRAGRGARRPSRSRE